MADLPLTNFQFGLHDVVILKPNRADSSSASLGQGVIYRQKVNCSFVIYILVQEVLAPNMGYQKLYSCCVFDLDLLQQDSSITVAFDDIPEDGLNAPLRLEKVANEVYICNK